MLSSYPWIFLVLTEFRIATTKEHYLLSRLWTSRKCSYESRNRLRCDYSLLICISEQLLNSKLTSQHISCLQPALQIWINYSHFTRVTSLRDHRSIQAPRMLSPHNSSASQPSLGILSSRLPEDSCCNRDLANRTVGYSVRDLEHPFPPTLPLMMNSQQTVKEYTISRFCESAFPKFETVI